TLTHYHCHYFPFAVPPLSTTKKGEGGGERAPPIPHRDPASFCRPAIATPRIPPPAATGDPYRAVSEIGERLGAPDQGTLRPVFRGRSADGRQHLARRVEEEPRPRDPADLEWRIACTATRPNCRVRRRDRDGRPAW